MENNEERNENKRSIYFDLLILIEIILSEYKNEETKENYLVHGELYSYVINRIQKINEEMKKKNVKENKIKVIKRFPNLPKHLLEKIKGVIDKSYNQLIDDNDNSLELKKQNDLKKNKTEIINKKIEFPKENNNINNNDIKSCESNSKKIVYNTHNNSLVVNEELFIKKENELVINDKVQSGKGDNFKNLILNTSFEESDTFFTNEFEETQDNSEINTYMTSIKFNETNLLTSVNDQDNSINYYEENVNKLQKDDLKNTFFDLLKKEENFTKEPIIYMFKYEIKDEKKDEINEKISLFIFFLSKLIVFNSNPQKECECIYNDYFKCSHDYKIERKGSFILFFSYEENNQTKEIKYLKFNIIEKIFEKFTFEIKKEYFIDSDLNFYRRINSLNGIQIKEDTIILLF